MGCSTLSLVRRQRDGTRAECHGNLPTRPLVYWVETVLDLWKRGQA